VPEADGAGGKEAEGQGDEQGRKEDRDGPAQRGNERNHRIPELEESRQGVGELGTADQEEVGQAHQEEGRQGHAQGDQALEEKRTAFPDCEGHVESAHGGHHAARSGPDRGERPGGHQADRGPAAGEVRQVVMHQLRRRSGQRFLEIPGEAFDQAFEWEEPQKRHQEEQGREKGQHEIEGHLRSGACQVVLVQVVQEPAQEGEPGGHDGRSPVISTAGGDFRKQNPGRRHG